MLLRFPRSAVPVALFALFALVAPFGARSPAHAMPAAEAAAALRAPDRILLRVAQFDVREPPPAASAELSLSPEQLDAVRYWIVQVRGPLTDAVRARLEAHGADILSYIPNNAFLVRLDAL